jgi:hypothetical protein
MFVSKEAAYRAQDGLDQFQANLKALMFEVRLHDEINFSGVTVEAGVRTLY